MLRHQTACLWLTPNEEAPPLSSARQSNRQRVLILNFLHLLNVQALTLLHDPRTLPNPPLSTFRRPICPKTRRVRRCRLLLLTSPSHLPPAQAGPRSIPTTSQTFSTVSGARAFSREATIVLSPMPSRSTHGVAARRSWLKSLRARRRECRQTLRAAPRIKHHR